MKQVYFLFLAILFSSSALSQVVGNEWINYNQNYYSFSVYQTGIHKIDYLTLASSNVPVQAFSSDNIQIFGREKEIPLYIEDGGDGTMDNGDYILFYAEKNDGWLDSTLYDDPSWIGNPKYSLYNDTIQYFLTWNNSTSNKRFIIETDVSYNSYTPADYVLFETFESYAEQYNEGEKSASASSSFFVEGEGWGKNIINGVNGHTWNFSNASFANLYNGLNAPQINYKSVVVGSSNSSFTGAGNHHTNHTIGSTNYVLFDSVFTGYKSVYINKNFPVSIVSNSSSLNFKVNIVNSSVSTGASTDYQSINYWSFLYPRSLSFSNLNQAYFKAINNLSGKIRLDMQNLNITNPIMFSLGNVPRKIPVTVNGNTLQSIIPNEVNSNEQAVIIQDFSSLILVSNLTPVNGTSSFTDYSNIANNDNAVIFVYPSILESATFDYASYRSSVLGGNHNVVLADVNELYQQYGGGINKHINGIRRFAFHLYTNSINKPIGLFLIGKGIREATIYSVTSNGDGSRQNASFYNASLMPSFGHPSSDVCITSNLPGFDKYAPLIPTGRIAASSNQELIDYLKKVKDYEAQQNQSSIYNTDTKDWQKKILHFSGGTGSVEQQAFQLQLNALADIVEDDYFAGDVTLVAKETGNPISPIELQELKDRISNGVSIMTFFGHSSSTQSGFDINLDEPQYWNNYQKYPVLLANSCYNGNLFQGSQSKSEQFVLTPDAGVIAYIGTINLGFSSPLNIFSREFYKQLSLDNYSGYISEHIRNSIDSIIDVTSSLAYESTFLQMTLHGDPMLRFNYHSKPEIEISPSDLTIGPSVIDLSTDSLELNISFKNLGKSILDTFVVQIIRDFPSSFTDSIYQLNIEGMDYDKSFQFKIPFQPSIGVGLNKFSILVDLPSVIDEQYDEFDNNKIEKNFLLNIDGIQPILPYNYAVVPKDTITLFASTINPLAEFNSYRFEIDTTHNFSSSFHKYSQVSGLGGVQSVSYADWLSVSSNTSDPLILEDSIVYYWRVALDEANPIWKRYSFEHIPEKEGWGQDDFFQFTDNSVGGVILDSVTQKRSFYPFVKEISCLTKAYTTVPEEYGENAWYLSNEQQDYGILTFDRKFHVAIIDKTTLTPWETRYGSQNPNNNFGNANDGNPYGLNRPFKYFTFNQNSPAQMASFRDLIENIVPNGNYILIYTPMENRYDYWDAHQPQLYQMFQNMGSDSIFVGCNRPNKPFIFLTRKGDPNFVVELFCQTNEDIFLDTIISGIASFGFETSPFIGPSANWNSIYWKQNTIDQLPLTDSTRLKILVYDAQQNYHYTIDTLFTNMDSILQLDNLIDASQYPFIRLSSEYNDIANGTPSQVGFWHVLYDLVPEAAIDGSDGFAWVPGTDTVAEGQTIEFAIDVKNISELPMDSLLINYFIIDDNQNMSPINYPRQDSLLVGGVIRDTIQINTTGLTGQNFIWMEVNPYIDATNTITDQPELSHVNNLLQFPFYVRREDQNPILDVTFNGIHILNEDIVSPTTEILISLKDENPFLIMSEDEDTSHFAIYLTDPDGIQTRIPFIDVNGQIIMQWVPANAQNKRFKIVYPKYFDKSGIYTLIVEGSDKTGNPSGDYAYQIDFEVIHESMITQLMNYPNPFSTSTRFVFTLTGDFIPDDLQIQIMNINGRVVKEIDEFELGSINIGRNITEYAWDGRDDFGDQLANGVYLYRVKMKINGQDFKLKESGADNYFHKGFGKMYLLR